MKIRLLILECKDWHKGWYCKASDDIDQRIKILKHAINKSDNIELIITSHNFLAFYPECSVNAKEFIEVEVIPKLEEKIENKKPLIIGFDLLNLNMRFNRIKKGKSQRKTKAISSNLRFNPYDRGIDAAVCYIQVEHNSYVYGTHIWNVGKILGNVAR